MFTLWASMRYQISHNNTKLMKHQIILTHFIQIHTAMSFFQSNQQPDSANPVYKAAYENWKQWLDSDNVGFAGNFLN
jgi:hypothetical protein